MQTLRTKISLWYFYSFTILFLVFAFVFLSIYNRITYDHFDNRLTSLASELTRFLELADSDSINLMNLAGQEDILFEVYKEKSLFLSFQIRPGFFEQWILTDQSGWFTAEKTRFLIQPIPAQNMVLIVGINLRYYFRDLANIFFLLTATSLLSILSIWFIGSAISKKLLSPLQKIGQELMEIVNSDFEGRRVFLESTGKEIDDLVFAINLSLGKIERLFKEIKGFSSNMAHEIRTPLTLVKATLENLKNISIDSKARKSIDEASQEVEEAILFLSDLLLLSNLEKGIIERFQLFDSGEIILQNFEKASKLYPQKQIEVEISQIFEILGAAQLISHAIYILLDNACKYSTNDKILLKVYREGQEKIIRIDSIGKKLQWEELKKKPIAKGHGLGLNLCEKIMQIHNGELVYTYEESKNRENCKNSFIIRLP